MENPRLTAEEIRYRYVCDSYQIIYEMASGEGDRTLLAKSIRDGRPVIEKIMPSSQGCIYEKLKTLQHPNVVPVWDVAYHEEQCVVIMEYVSGITLKELIGQRGALTGQEAVEILVQLLNGLEFLHGLGVVHRDIHPGNILISSDHVVKILDLGIARKVKENRAQDTSILGTVGFAAPEQYGFAQTDGRTDIYSAGVLLNVMLTGKVPNVIMAPGRLGQIIHKCIEIAPEQRYRDVRSLRSDLQQLPNGLQRVRGKGAQGALGAEAEAARRSGIPGFRTGKRWKQIIAVPGYGIMALFTVFLTMDASFKRGVPGLLLELLAMVLVFWLPFIIMTNWGNWDRRVMPFRLFDKDVMIAVRIIVPMIMIYGGMALDTYLRGAGAG